MATSGFEELDESDELARAAAALAQTPRNHAHERAHDKAKEWVIAAATTRFLAESYSKLQLIIGGLAVTLPLALVGIAYLIDGQGIQGSISSYYYTRSGGYFVGTLFAIGIFLFS